MPYWANAMIDIMKEGGVELPYDKTSSECDDSISKICDKYIMSFKEML